MGVTSVHMAEMVIAGRISKVWVDTMNMLFILGDSAAS